MKTQQLIQRLSLLLVLCTPLNLYAGGSFGEYAIYPFGGSFHFKKEKQTKNGNLNYFAVSKFEHKDAWHFEKGIGTFVDTYHVRSFIAFGEVSHDNYKYGLITPLINAHCAYKGHTHKNKGRRLQCFPSLKFKIGRDKGVFLKVTPIPKLGSLTNGQIVFEMGYKF